MKKVLFIDRDGTILTEPEDKQLDHIDKTGFLPGVICNLKKIAALDYELVMASNQDGLGTASFPEEDFWPVQNMMLKTLKSEGIEFDDILIDPTMPHENAPTRKPRTGMFTKYMKGDYDLKASYVIGDRETDARLAENLGAKSIIINSDKSIKADFYVDCWDEIWRILKYPDRKAAVKRITNETQIEIEINLDGSGSKQITPYESALYFEPQWFPDDDEILTGRFGYHAQFYRILINGSVITRITTDDSISYRFPRLSPDGLKIAYEKRSIPKNTIWVMDADGKNEKLLSEPFYEDWRPEWTGDAAYIVYFNSKGLWLINADGSDRKFLIETGYNHAHHCSPANSNKIVFGNINGVFLIKNDGTGLKQLSDVSCSGYPILWSHDGSRIAFRGDANNDGEKGVCIIKLNESEIYEITFSHLNIADAPSRAFDWIANQIE